jgi:hypothetical protein
MTRKIIKPLNPLIFKVAGELAATFYEIGRSQGLTSVHKTPRAYAQANLEKFVPKAIEHLLDILANPSFPELAKNEIYEAIIDPINDPDLISGKVAQDKLDIKKLDDVVKQYEKRSIKHNILLNKPEEKKTVLHN